MEEPKSNVRCQLLWSSTLKSLQVSLPGAWNPLGLEENRCYPIAAQLNSPKHMQVQGNRCNRNNASKGIEQAAWYHFEITLSSLKHHSNWHGYWWLEKSRDCTHLQKIYEVPGKEKPLTLSHFLGMLGVKTFRSRF